MITTFKINGDLEVGLESIDGDISDLEFTLVDIETKETIEDDEVYRYVFEHYEDDLFQIAYDHDEPEPNYYSEGEPSAMDNWLYNDEHSPYL